MSMAQPHPTYYAGVCVTTAPRELLSGWRCILEGSDRKGRGVLETRAVSGSDSEALRHNQRFMAFLPGLWAKVLYLWFCSPFCPKGCRLLFEAMPTQQTSQHVYYVDDFFARDPRCQKSEFSTQLINFSGVYPPMIDDYTVDPLKCSVHKLVTKGAY